MTDDAVTLPSSEILATPDTPDSLSWTPSSIHSDIAHYDSHFLGDFWNGVPLVYKGKEPVINPELPTVLIVLGNSAVGKDAVIDPLIRDEVVCHAITATSRRRRVEKWLGDPDNEDAFIRYLDRFDNLTHSRVLKDLVDLNLIEAEPFDKYIWMPAQEPGETEGHYLARLRNRYDLIECDCHYGNVYGLPRASLNRAICTGRMPLIRTEVNGAETIIQALEGQMNVVVVTVLPDNQQVVIDRLNERVLQDHLDPNYTSQRMAEDEQRLLRFPDVTNFYLHNTEMPDDNGIPGLVRAQSSMREVVLSLMQ